VDFLVASFFFLSIFLFFFLFSRSNSLDPTQTTKLKGDFRTGKRINMRKVIPYIASNFKKDKIWLRRQKPSKREYHVLVGVDDSESIALGGGGELLQEAVATITQALMLVDVGKLAIVKFGTDFELLHAFSETFSDTDAAQVRRFYSCICFFLKFSLFFLLNLNSIS
jgi:midasin (ATPase involved in ribosome maturation)